MRCRGGIGISVSGIGKTGINGLICKKSLEKTIMASFFMPGFIEYYKKSMLTIVDIDVNIS